ncbi:MAG: cupin domain-containing protein [Candidatus Omnitrophota bacterium]|nr:cupin domain-containing protein [Candidatus Omnitrophota bacterium]
MATKKFKPAQKISVNNFIQYQAGCVVSQEIIKKPTGTVTVFAFAKGQGLSEHVAPFDALVYILDGTVKITIAKKPFVLTAGSLIVMPAHKPHALSALTAFKMMLVMVRS